MSIKSFIMKHVFVSRVAAKVNLTHWKTEKVMDAIMSEIREVVDEGKSVRFGKIGTFSPGIKAKKNFYNPHTGKIEESPQQFSPKFKMSKIWRRLFHKSREEKLKEWANRGI